MLLCGCHLFVLKVQVLVPLLISLSPVAWLRPGLSPRKMMQQQNKSVRDNEWMNELVVGVVGQQRIPTSPLRLGEGPLGREINILRGANEMATRTQRWHKILSLRWPMTFRQGSYWGDSPKALFSSWVFTCTPSAKELSLYARVLFFSLLLNKHIAAKFTVLFLYNLGVNMSAHATNVCVCVFFC